MWDILSLTTPPINAYNQLKERLLQLYEQGEKDHYQEFLATQPLGGRRLSELAADLMALCPQWDVEGDIIKYMFLFRLPPTMQALLGEDNTSTLQSWRSQGGLTPSRQGCWYMYSAS